MPQPSLRSPSREAAMSGRRRTLGRIAATTLAAIGLATAAAGAQAAPDLETEALTPKPLTGVIGTSITLGAEAANDGDSVARRPRLYFLLSKDRRASRRDEFLPAGTIRSLGSGATRTVRRSVRIPADTPAGLYYVIACADVPGPADGAADCDATDKTLPVVADQVVSGPPATQAPPAPPAPQGSAQPPSITPFYVNKEIDCPFSAHGQGGSKCVWTETEPQVRSNGDPAQVEGLFLCPESHPYPFVVALGFDPLWDDTSSAGDVLVETVSKTRYARLKSFTGREYWASFSGQSTQTGYVSAKLSAQAVYKDTTNWILRFEFLCSTKKATSALP